MSGKPAARQGDMTQYGGSIVQVQPGCASVPPPVGLFGVPRRVTSGHPVNPLLGAKVLPGETDLARPGLLPFILSPHLQQLPDKNARAGGEPRPRQENACGYPPTAAR